MCFGGLNNEQPSPSARRGTRCGCADRRSPAKSPNTQTPAERYKGYILPLLGVVCLSAATSTGAWVAAPWTASPILQASSQQAGALFEEAASPPGVAARPEPAVLRQRWVRVNFDRLREASPQSVGGSDASQTLQLNLFPDAEFVARRKNVDRTPTGYVWVGELLNHEVSTVTLSVNGSAMVGSVTTANAAYAIRPADGGVHVIRQIDRSALPPEAPPIGVDTAGLAADALPMADDGSLIDVLVVYTPSARVAQGGTSAIEALIDLGVSETNQSYANSGAVQRIRLVRKEEIAYTESGNMNADVNRLRDVGDGFMDGVHAVRDAYGADLVHLIENSNDSCGIAFHMSEVSGAFATSAFGVTHYDCVSPNYSFAHEMGHNMGLRHDIYVDPATTPYPYSHGYVNQAAFPPGPVEHRWRDIMAYENQCIVAGFSCPRVLYFSNPLNTYTDDPMGNATADAVTSLNNTRVTVANFRAAISKKRQFQLITD